MILALLLLSATPQEHIAKGEAALTALEYEAAAFELMAAATDPTATPEEKLRANLLAGIAHRVLGKDTDAHLNFRYVLLHAPSTRLPDDTPPKVSFFFESVREEIEAEHAAEPRPTPVVTAPPSTSPWLIAGAALASVGAVTALASGGAVAYAESSLADPDRPGPARTSLRALGSASVAGAVVGLLLAGAGGALVAWDPP